jgi:hypothetical protein
VVARKSQKKKCGNWVTPRVLNSEKLSDLIIINLQFSLHSMESLLTGSRTPISRALSK